MPARYALCFVPENGTPLADLGRKWLGRDIHSAETQDQPVIVGVSQERVAELTKWRRLDGMHSLLNNVIFPRFEYNNKTRFSEANTTHYYLRRARMLLETHNMQPLDEATFPDVRKEILTELSRARIYGIRVQRGSTAELERTGWLTTLLPPQVGDRRPVWRLALGPFGSAEEARRVGKEVGVEGFVREI